MGKIIINETFGGYDFSNKATLEYLVRTGATNITFHCIVRDSVSDKLVYPEISKELYLIQDSCTMEHYVYGDHVRVNGKEFDPRKISRIDPIAIEIVEELGCECNTYHSELVVEEYDETLDCVICEYDGVERIEQSVPREGKKPTIYFENLSEDEWCEH